ncbi:MAG: cyclic nucleotide-binding domain-containing protein [Anaerolineales bacterium]|nr:cyclic nucleotide-binding domain-containing protein [Anaerolineales bacterium]
MISTEELKRYPHFAGMPGVLLRDIASISRNRDFVAGDRLFSEGNTARHLMFLKSGEVAIVYRLGDDREVVADTLVAGDAMAWSALLEPHVLTGSGVASKDGSLLEIEAESLRRICDENRDYGYTVMKEVGKTLRTRLSAMRVQAAASIREPLETTAPLD